MQVLIDIPVVCHPDMKMCIRDSELCSTIKNDIETSHIPVLLLTALGEEQNILDGLDIGADEYICLLYTSPDVSIPFWFRKVTGYVKEILLL